VVRGQGFGNQCVKSLQVTRKNNSLNLSLLNKISKYKVGHQIGKITFKGKTSEPLIEIIKKIFAIKKRQKF
jgi:hypothetical protein